MLNPEYQHVASICLFSEGHERASKGGDDAGCKADRATGLAEWATTTRRAAAAGWSRNGAVIRTGAGTTRRAAAAGWSRNGAATRAGDDFTSGKLVAQRESITNLNDVQHTGVTTHRELTTTPLVPAIEHTLYFTLDARYVTDGAVRALL